MNTMADGAREKFEAWAKRRGLWVNQHPQNPGWYLVEETRGLWAAWQAALAARQPVGQEPVAWMTHHDEPMLYPTCSEAAAYCDDDEPPIPLYAAPPAQAVDLGQLQRFAPHPENRAFGWMEGMREEASGDWLHIDDVRALIDSKAVGNG